MDIFFSFGFCYYFRRLVYGIFNDTKTYKSEHKTVIEKRLGKGLGWGNWLWLKEMEPSYLNWDYDVTPWLSIIDNSLKENIKEKVKRLAENIKELDG